LVIVGTGLYAHITNNNNSIKALNIVRIICRYKLFRQ